MDGKLRAENWIPWNHRSPTSHCCPIPGGFIGAALTCFCQLTRSCRNLSITTNQVGFDHLSLEIHRRNRRGNKRGNYIPRISKRPIKQAFLCTNSMVSGPTIRRGSVAFEDVRQGAAGGLYEFLTAGRLSLAGARLAKRAFCRNPIQTRQPTIPMPASVRKAPLSPPVVRYTKPIRPGPKNPPVDTPRIFASRVPTRWITTTLGTVLALQGCGLAICVPRACHS